MSWVAMNAGKAVPPVWPVILHHRNLPDFYRRSNKFICRACPDQEGGRLQVLMLLTPQDSDTRSPNMIQRSRSWFLLLLHNRKEFWKIIQQILLTLLFLLSHWSSCSDVTWQLCRLKLFVFLQKCLSFDDGASMREKSTKQINGN